MAPLVMKLSQKRVREKSGIGRISAGSCANMHALPLSHTSHNMICLGLRQMCTPQSATHVNPMSAPYILAKASTGYIIPAGRNGTS
eukprot:438794-Amphidinium_carterae.2